LVRALDKLRVNITRADELAQQRETIAQQAQEIMQLRAFVTQYQQWLQENARPLTQAYDYVKSDIGSTHSR
jgi:hypothetical protein